MSVYDVKIKRLALLLLPTALRKPLMAAFVQGAVQGVNVLHGSFMQWRGDRDYRLSHNGQVCYLRAVLNDAFDPGERRIRVEDADSGMPEGTRLFMREEDRHVLAPARETGGAFVLNRRGYSGAAGSDFWVSVPYELMRGTDTARLAALVDAYRLASRRWRIRYY